MTLNVMVDLETLSTKSNACIIAIGAVAFDPNGDPANDTEFYETVDPTSCVGSDISGSTVLWWLQQSDEARRAFAQPGGHLAEVLARFTAWYPALAPLWGNGATADNVWLRNAYVSVGLQTPWRYTDDRCYRTLKNLYPLVGVDRVPALVAHNALADAKWQTAHLRAIWKEAGYAR